MSKKNRKEIIEMEAKKNEVNVNPDENQEAIEETPKKGFFTKVVDGAKTVGGKAVSGVKKHGKKVAVGFGVAVGVAGVIAYELNRNKKDDEEPDCGDYYTDQQYDWHDPEIEVEDRGEPEVPEEDKTEEAET